MSRTLDIYSGLTILMHILMLTFGYAVEVRLCVHARVCEASISMLSTLSSGNLCDPSSGTLHWEVSSHFLSQCAFVFMWGESLVA